MLTGVEMKIGPDKAPTTRISGSNPETIIVRGYDLVTDLIGQISFTDYIWLLVAGERPNSAQSRILDATLVAIAEHGLVPSVQASRMTLSAAPEAFQGAVAAGLLGCGSVILGSSEAAGQFAAEIIAERAKGRADAIQSTVLLYKAAKRAIPGFGHPLHKEGDPRAQKLFRLARELGLAGEYIDIMHQTEQELPALIGKPLKMNVSAAIPAVLLDAGYPLLALKGVPLLARAAGLIGHLLEEQQHPIGFYMSHAAASAITYVGPAPDGFIAAED